MVGNTEKSTGSLTYRDMSRIIMQTDILIISKKSINHGTGGNMMINSTVRSMIAIRISGRFIVALLQVLMQNAECRMQN
jgi:hypothetical protein